MLGGMTMRKRRLSVIGSGLAACGLLLAWAPASHSVFGVANTSGGVAAIDFTGGGDPQLACSLQLTVIPDPEFSNALTANGTIECNLPATIVSQYVLVRDRLNPGQNTGQIAGQGNVRNFYAAMVATANFGANGDRIAIYCVRVTFGAQTKSACAATAVPF